MNYKVAILGAGRIAYVHAQAINKHIDLAEVKWIIDPYLNQDAKERFTKLGINNFDTDYQVVLKDPEIDAVYICTPTPTHVDLTIKALEANKHVFCEKPLAFSLNEILKVKAVLEKSDKFFMIGHNRRFDHNFQAVKEVVVKKELGEIIQLKITSRDPDLPPISYLKNSGGIFMDMMIHDLDMACFIMGKKIVSVYATGATFFDSAVASEANDIDTAMVVLNFSDNSMAVIDNCRKSNYGYDQRLEVQGTKGSCQIGNDTLSSLVVSTEKGIVHEKPLYFFLERYMQAYIQESIAFFTAIANKIAPNVGINEAYQAIALAIAAKKSYISKEVVYLKNGD